MKVYGIYFGCMFEGGGVSNTLYKDIADARKALIERKDKEQREIEVVYEDDPEDREGYSFKQQKDNPDVWHNTIDVIRIQEFELI